MSREAEREIQIPGCLPLIAMASGILFCGLLWVSQGWRLIRLLAGLF